MDRGHHEALISMAPPGSRAEVALFLDYAQDSGYEEVPDPYYGGANGFEAVLDLLEEAAAGLVDALPALVSAKTR